MTGPLAGRAVLELGRQTQGAESFRILSLELPGPEYLGVGEAVAAEHHADSRPKLALEVTQDALVLNRGRVSYLGKSAELLADPARLTSLIVAS